MKLILITVLPNMSCSQRPRFSHLSGIWAPGCCTRLLLRPAPSPGRTAALPRFRCRRCRSPRETAALRGGRGRPQGVREWRWLRKRRMRTGGSDGADVAADGAAAADPPGRPAAGGKSWSSPSRDPSSRSACNSPPWGWECRTLRRGWTVWGWRTWCSHSRALWGRFCLRPPPSLRLLAASGSLNEFRSDAGGDQVVLIPPDSDTREGRSDAGSSQQRSLSKKVCRFPLKDPQGWKTSPNFNVEAA